MADEIQADCKLSARSLGGRPGSRYLVHCPAHCLIGTVRGSGIYTDDSSICVTAIHAGVLKPFGGRVQILIGGGAKSFSGSIRNGIESYGYGPLNRSFTVQPVGPRQKGNGTFTASNIAHSLFYWFLVFAAIFFVVWWFQRRSRKVNALAMFYQELARERNLDYSRPDINEAGIVSGNDGRREFLLKSYSIRSNPDSRGTAIHFIHIETFWNGAGATPDFVAYPRSRLRSPETLPGRLPGEREFKTNDDFFDREIYVGTTGGDLASLFKPEARAAVLDYFMDPQDWDLLLTAGSIKSTITIRSITVADIDAHLQMQQEVADALEKAVG